MLPSRSPRQGDDLLEAIDLDATDHSEFSSAPARPDHRDPRDGPAASTHVERARRTNVSRRWFAVVACLLASAVAFMQAGRLVAIDRDTAAVADTWSDVRAVDRDLASAERRVEEVSSIYGASRGLERQRAQLFAAAEARYRSLLARLDVTRPLHTESPLRSKAATVLDTIVTEIDASHRRHSSSVRMAALSDELPDRPPGDGLPEAAALIETLSNYADRRTGLVLGALDDRGRFWVIDVDRNRSERIAVDGVSADASLTAYANQFVFRSGDGRLQSFALTADGDNLALSKRWDSQGDRSVTSHDGTRLFVQRGDTVDALDDRGSVVASIAVPRRTKLVSSTPDGGLWLAILGVGFARMSPTGDFEPTTGEAAEAVDLTDFESLPEPGPNQRDAALRHGVFTDENGRIRIVDLQEEGTSSILRAYLPRMRSVAALP